MNNSKINKPLNIILLGDPAAGKATQAQFLTKKFALYDFDMGKELWALRNRKPEVDSFLKKNYDQGKLTPTKVVRDILKYTIGRVRAGQGILFDGHPKMLGEAKIVYRMLKKHKRRDPIVIYLSIPIEETIKRMHNRVGYFKGKYGKRMDDTNAALKNRVAYYRKNVSQVVKFYNKEYNFKKVSGMGSESAVNKRMFAAVNSMIKNDEQLYKN